ncbi:MAG: hypothetical protein COA96_08970 [SAR86 cluster bacterium]|uniref:Cobalamin biosynthesis protein CbiX n=1 Tax=SAR86 cluster bacterium TaxID=2030880 RepID=A0A2A5AZK2_9GAMM|nr:MAG: hypothetical protein COA96_08970 [SAR86 cluster bacterium]
MYKILMLLKLSFVSLFLLSACASSTVGDSATAPSFGLLVMAHGADEQWNQGVIDSLEPLRQNFPIEVAFGMADAASLQESVSRLESQGVNQIGVVRLFISGESWYERTLQILGIEDGAPTKPMDAHSDSDMPAHSMAFWKIDSNASFSVSKEGLAEAEEMDDVLLSRFLGLSKNPAMESVVILAHGPGDDAENERWINYIQQRTAKIQQETSVHDVKVFTLREDWQDKREVAEQQIRNHIQNANSNGRSVIVVPFRVQGFGPYAEVLAGQRYEADKLGLIPHENVTVWIENQAELTREGAFLSQL